MCCGPSWRSLERSVSEVVTSTDAETPQTPPSQRFLPADVTPNHDSQPAAATAGYTARRGGARSRRSCWRKCCEPSSSRSRSRTSCTRSASGLVGRGLSRRIACVGTTVIAFVAAAILVVPLLYVLYRRRAELIEILEQIPDVVPISVGGFELVIEMVPYVAAAAEVWVRQVALALAAAAPRLVLELVVFTFLVYGLLYRPGSVEAAVFGVVPAEYHDIPTRLHERTRDAVLDLRPAGGDGRGGDVRARIRGVLGLRVRVTGLACRHRRRPPVHPHYRPERARRRTGRGRPPRRGDRAGDCRASTRSSRPRLLRPRRGGDPDAARRLDRKDLRDCTSSDSSAVSSLSARSDSSSVPSSCRCCRSDRHALRARRAADPTGSGKRGRSRRTDRSRRPFHPIHRHGFPLSDRASRIRCPRRILPPRSTTLRVSRRGGSTISLIARGAFEFRGRRRRRGRAGRRD